MGNGIKVAKADAQALHSFLVENGLLGMGERPMREKDFVVFPLAKKLNRKGLAEIGKALSLDSERQLKIVSKKFSSAPHGDRTWREALEGKLPKKLMKSVPSSFDSLGNAAIIEVPDELEGRGKALGKALMEVNKSIESVFMKTGAHTGIFRNEPVKLVAGKKIEKAVYREHGCTFRISIGKVFFSPRLSTERRRISGLIKPGEEVAALFAGVGPFPIVFAKNSQMGKAVAIELNPVAVGDMKENIKMNKVEGRVEAVFGDVKALAEKPGYFGKFDRAVMPLPKGGESFLEDAIKYIKPSGGVVHYYQFVSRDDPYSVPHRQIEAACKSLGRKFEVLFERQVREYAPEIIQVVVDFRTWA
ncbi:tRNA (guanine(37)-N1)-methyltransferase Trm5b [uncultured archaeon]|nr:tRNA (guanine(37)-N1)-methyltransferase Trm5b [uncultured archaeon]